MTCERRSRLPGIETMALLLLAAFSTGCERLKELGKTATAGTAAVSAATGKAEIRDISAGEFDDFVKRPGRLVVVDFYADWCPPCRQLAPRLEAVTREFGGKVALAKVNVDQAKDLASRHGVSSIPDVRLFRDGRQVDRFVGGIPEQQIRTLFEKHSAGLSVEETPAASDEAAAPAEPKIQPMKKDWMPPGIERR